MKKLLFVLMLFPAISFGQLKNQNATLDIKNEIMKPVNDNFLGLSFIDFSKLTMSHSISLSYFSTGENSLSQSLYLNTISYQISDPLSLKVQWGVRNYPYSTFSKSHPAFQSGLFFSGAELNYRPSDKLFMKLQIHTEPWMNYPYYRDFSDDRE